MQLFYMFSFAVVALHAAALPQPAGLSEKYSDSVSANLASGLGTRSYQPAFNSQKDSAISMLLKRRDDSKGYSGDDGESDPSPPPAPTSNCNEQENDTPRDKLEAASIKLASDIDNVGSGLAKLPVYMRKIGKVIGGKAGELMVEYLKIILYLDGRLNRWLRGDEKNVVDFIKAGLGDAKYSKIEPVLTRRLRETTAGVQSHLKAAFGALSKILEKNGPVIQNAETMNESFKRVVHSYGDVFWTLRTPTREFPDGKKLFEYLTNVIRNINEFSEKRQDRFNIIMEQLKAAPSS